MEIGLREWLIIGGILVIALILIDGWRRIRGNRNRIRMDIDRSAIGGDVQGEESSQSNPELPNGGARRRSSGARQERREPSFAPDTSAPEDESDRLLEFEREPVTIDSPSRPPIHRQAVADERPEPVPTEAAASETGTSETGTSATGTSATGMPETGTSETDTPVERDPLHEMDPLFDDVPVEPRPLRARRSDDQRSDARRSDARHDQADDEPFAMSFDFDPEQPIPVLMDRVRASAAAAPQPRRDEPVEAARAGSDQAENTDLHPELPLEERRDERPEAIAGEAEPVRSRQEPSAERENEPEPAPAPNTRSTDRARSETAPKRPAPEITPDPEDMLVIFVVARRGELLPGAIIHKIVDACGMEFGEMGIFHRHERPDAQGSLQFSMANALQPGTFDLDTLDGSETPAVTFFMSMHDPADPQDAYECMLATAETLARHLDAELLDGDRSVMRPQTKEHYRERIRDFEIHKRVKRAH